MSGPLRADMVTAWWSAEDRATVIALMQRIPSRRVLEFGPGSSTLALIDGGAERIDACEDDQEWYDIYYDRIVLRHPSIVRFHFYDWADPLTVPGLDHQHYDLALIDGPRETPRRPVTIRYALDRCDYVLVPLEHPEWGQPGRMLDVVQRLAGRRPIEVLLTGPPSYAMALVRP